MKEEKIYEYFENTSTYQRIIIAAFSHYFYMIIKCECSNNNYYSVLYYY